MLSCRVGFVLFCSAIYISDLVCLRRGCGTGHVVADSKDKDSNNQGKCFGFLSLSIATRNRLDPFLLPCNPFLALLLPIVQELVVELVLALPLLDGLGLPEGLLPLEELLVSLSSFFLEAPS